MSERPIGIVKDEKYPKMYRLLWGDGSVSADFYNLTRAKDNLKYYDLKEYNTQRRFLRQFHAIDVN